MSVKVGRGWFFVKDVHEGRVRLRHSVNEHWFQVPWYVIGDALVSESVDCTIPEEIVFDAGKWSQTLSEIYDLLGNGKQVMLEVSVGGGVRSTRCEQGCNAFLYGIDFEQNIDSYEEYGSATLRVRETARVTFKVVIDACDFTVVRSPTC